MEQADNDKAASHSSTESFYKAESAAAEATTISNKEAKPSNAAEGEGLFRVRHINIGPLSSSSSSDLRIGFCCVFDRPYIYIRLFLGAGVCGQILTLEIVVDSSS